jgi:galactonate dehydratase
MKITRVKPLLADGGHRNFVFAKVETDQDGLVGWGEASLEGKPRSVAGAVEDLEELILGEDPRRVEHCWQKMYRGAFWRLGVIGLSALSGIDQALWDIKGKEMGKPVHELLGGRVRDRVLMYTHFDVGDRPLEAIVEQALSKVEKGYTAIKTVPVPLAKAVDGMGAVKEAERMLCTVREAVGDGVEILLDFHGRLSPAMAIQYGRAFEPYRPYFLEEPVQAENPKMMADVTRALRTPIATGERLFTRYGFREILELGAAHVLQPDLCHAGGISEVRKIAAMAEVYYTGLAPHNPLGAVSTAACIQVDLVCPNFLIQEIVDPDEYPESQTLVKEPLEVVDGYIEPPTAPGIGVEVDEAAVKRQPPDFSKHRHYPATYPDGTVADS